MNLGKVKFYFDRWRGYASNAQFLMVLYLFVKESGIGWYWFLLCVPVSALVVWIDAKHVLPGELEEYMRKNPRWKDLEDSISQITRP